MEALTWHLIEGLSAAASRDVFAGPGSDPALGARTLDQPTAGVSAAARRTSRWDRRRWCSEHHAYLQLMLGLARRRTTSTWCTTTACTTCR